MLKKEIYSIEQLKENSIIEKDAILFFRKDRINKTNHYSEFSNFNPSKIQIKDEFNLCYPTVENYFQACKTTSFNLRIPFTNSTAYHSKFLGKNIKLRDDWEKIKYDIMRNGLEQKFYDKHFEQLLLSTGNKQLIEWTWWGDKIWGMCSKSKIGANALGKLLMELREKLK